MIKKKHIRLYSKIVKLLSEESTCSREKVGALLLKDTRIIATGYNGSLPNHPHCIDVGCVIQDNHCISSIHAEQNVILFCAKHGISMKGCVLFTTHSPCEICAKLLIQAGISKVYYLKPYYLEENRFIKELDCYEVKDG